MDSNTKLKRPIISAYISTFILTESSNKLIYTNDNKMRNLFRPADFGNVEVLGELVELLIELFNLLLMGC